MAFVIFLPGVISHVLSQFLQNVIFKDDKLLVGRRIYVKTAAGVFENIMDFSGHLNSMPADPAIKIILKQCGKLYTCQSALRRQCAVLLDPGKEMGRFFSFRKYNGFPVQRTNLGAADIKYITQPGNQRESNICSVCFQSVAHTCSVKKQFQMILPAHS